MLRQSETPALMRLGGSHNHPSTHARRPAPTLRHRGFSVSANSAISKNPTTRLHNYPAALTRFTADSWNYAPSRIDETHETRYAYTQGLGQWGKGGQAHRAYPALAQAQS